MALCLRLPGWAGTRKEKPIWILLTRESVSGSGISWAICKSAPRSRQITTPAPHHSVFWQAGCPSCRPTNSVKALKAIHSFILSLFCLHLRSRLRWLTILAVNDRDTAAGIEDGEILNTVKLEPRTSDDEDARDCTHTSLVGRHTKRFITTSSVPPPPGRASQRGFAGDGRLRVAADCFDSATTDTKRQSCSRDVSLVTRNAKRSRLSKDCRNPRHPGSYGYRYWMFAVEINKQITVRVYTLLCSCYFIAGSGHRL